MHTKSAIFTLVSALLLLFQGFPTSAKVAWTHPLPVLPDSSNFVTASLLHITPGNEIYSSLGHSAIRMECPTWDLDYCFSFETDVKPSDYLRFFSGQANGHIVAVPTATFLNPYQKEGRGITQYELNLSHHEKQELWRILDNDMVNDENRKFNFLQNNCSSVSLHAIEDALINEEMDVAWPHYMTQSNVPALKHIITDRWLYFISLTLLGSDAALTWDNRERISPEVLTEVLADSKIIDNNTSRPVFTNNPIKLTTQKTEPAQSVISPSILFSKNLQDLITV